MKKICLLVLVILVACSTNSMAQSCPNGDFESWISSYYDNPTPDWYTSNPQSVFIADSPTVWKVTGQSGQAIHIQTAIAGTDTLQAFITNSYGDPTQGIGGVPYSQQPDSVHGYFRCNLPGNDSAILLVFFKKNGSIVSQDMYKLRPPGGSQSTFIAFALPLSLATVPDTVIIAATSSNLFGSGLQSGSWVELDELSFSGSGVTQAIPGGSFDTWTNASLDVPTGWHAPVDFATNGIIKLTSAYAGNYAVELTSTATAGGNQGNIVSPAQLTTGSLKQQNNIAGGLPYTLTTDTLTGYYQYIPAGIDTAWVNITLKNNGNIAGGFGMPLLTATSWTYFELPFTAFMTPDSMRIDIYSSAQSAMVPGSVLRLDYLQLKSQPLPPDVVHTLPGSSGIVIYPNPATDILNMKFEQPMQGNISISIYDMVGRVMMGQDYPGNGAGLSLSIKNLPAGMYFYELQNKDVVIKDKFIKE